MTARLRSFLLVFAMVWQALAWLTPVSQGLGTQGMANLLSHAQELDHHHHQDRSLHADDNAEAPAHFHVSDGVQTMGLVPMSQDGFHFPPPSAPLPRVSDAFCSVTPEGLLRPPQALA